MALGNSDWLWLNQEFEQRYQYATGVNWANFIKRMAGLRPDLSRSIIEDAAKQMQIVDKWAYEKFLAEGFNEGGQWIGWAKFKELLVNAGMYKKREKEASIRRMRKAGFTYSCDVLALQACKVAEIALNQAPERQHAQVISSEQSTAQPAPSQLPIVSAPQPILTSEDFPTVSSLPTEDVKNGVATLDQPATEIADDNRSLKEPGEHSNTLTSALTETTAPESLPALTEVSSDENGSSIVSEDNITDEERLAAAADMISFALPDFTQDVHVKEPTTDSLKLAPLVSDMILEGNSPEFPQFGLLGSCKDLGAKVYQNTNVPFASFICGLQGSGKSHTTSCMLENACVQVNDGKFAYLQSPLSAMVFAYDDFNGDGAGFNISEATSLAFSRPELPRHYRAGKVTVLVSPSNPSIAALYKMKPNVTVIPFKIDPASLTVNTILTLMAVDESGTVPLYLAQLTKILRDINVQFGGKFSYKAFRERLALCNFNQTQNNMLQMRLDLLESFLDLQGNAPQPQFGPGEITIMDMSCPFVDANTACVLFKLGLERYLKSKVAGKMVVLDEAHKYMLNVPGAKDLKADLIRLIRLQRHKGVRTIIATQEPTLLTDLIALCDVAVIHRFSSPKWFAALREHIPMSGQDQNVLLEDIEGLRPGNALIYAPNAIVGYDEKGELMKGLGKFLKVKIRNRITYDGGRSVLAV